MAITTVMLLALGFSPLKSAALSLIGNTAPVAFGSIATPIVTLSAQTDLPVDDLGAMVGRQTPFLALIVLLPGIGNLLVALVAADPAHRAEMGARGRAAIEEGLG